MWNEILVPAKDLLSIPRTILAEGNVLFPFQSETIVENIRRVWNFETNTFLHEKFSDAAFFFALLLPPTVPGTISLAECTFAETGSSVPNAVPYVPLN